MSRDYIGGYEESRLHFIWFWRCYRALDFCNGLDYIVVIMIVESLWFYLFLGIAGFIWIYLTE